MATFPDIAECQRLAQELCRVSSTHDESAFHLSHDLRTRIVETLSLALVDDPLLQDYCSALRIEQNKLDQTEFPPSTSEADGDWPIESIIQNGLEPLADRQLIQIACNLEGLQELSDMIHEFMTQKEVGEVWWRWSMNTSAHRFPEVESMDTQPIMERLRTITDETDASSISTPDRLNPDVGMPHDITRRPLFRFAIAASLLIIGGLVGRYFAPHGPGLNGNTLLVANASIAFRPNRGADEVPHIEIVSPLSGFATIVSLAPDRRPLVFPQLGGADIAISSEEPSESYPLPKDTTHVIFVVTETPSGEPIRAIENTLLRDLGIGDERRIRDELRRQLEQKGFRRIAIGESPIKKASG